jgi:predicted nucleic acid-binding Zn ribbon protein
MPKYVYQNLNTGEHYEFEQGFHDPAYTHHPETGEPIKRLIFAPAVIFKGSGWYVKDSKAASGKPEASAPKAESSEVKPESKAPAKSESLASAAD